MSKNPKQLDDLMSIEVPLPWLQSTNWEATLDDVMNGVPDEYVDDPAIIAAWTSANYGLRVHWARLPHTNRWNRVDIFVTVRSSECDLENWLGSDGAYEAGAVALEGLGSIKWVLANHDSLAAQFPELPAEPPLSDGDEDYLADLLQYELERIEQEAEATDNCGSSSPAATGAL